MNFIYSSWKCERKIEIKVVNEKRVSGYQMLEVATRKQLLTEFIYRNTFDFYFFARLTQNGEGNDCNEREELHDELFFSFLSVRAWRKSAKIIETRLALYTNAKCFLGVKDCCIIMSMRKKVRKTLVFGSSQLFFTFTTSTT